MRVSCAWAISTTLTGRMISLTSAFSWLQPARASAATIKPATGNRLMMEWDEDIVVLPTGGGLATPATGGYFKALIA